MEWLRKSKRHVNVFHVVSAAATVLMEEANPLDTSAADAGCDRYAQSASTHKITVASTLEKRQTYSSGNGPSNFNNFSYYGDKVINVVQGWS